eukprot:6462731-Prymnesium_polylepis.1
MRKLRTGCLRVGHTGAWSRQLGAPNQKWLRRSAPLSTRAHERERVPRPARRSVQSSGQARARRDATTLTPARAAACAHRVGHAPAEAKPTIGT